MRVAPALLALVVLAGCGSNATKQADDLHSLAAEGVLLAHDVGEGDAWGPYVRVHSEELAAEAASIGSAAKTQRLAATARLVARELESLGVAGEPQAKDIEVRLSRLAKILERLA
jgi:hypothetical protein